ncbi:MAG: TetR/AcrR family transcriptional regulator [bacterium]|nr:TetR/AcrR family transcriptional regulator [bacterium]
MNPVGPSTRDRLLRAAIDLFAARGYHAASVRDLCDNARANPGAVSYHFGGKRYLYRAAIRHAIDRLASSLTESLSHHPDDVPLSSDQVVNALHAQLEMDDATVKLLLRDLAEGGSAFLEGVAPLLRPLLDQAEAEFDVATSDRRDTPIRRTVLRSGAALLFLHGAWPMLTELFGFSSSDRHRVLDLLRD